MGDVIELAHPKPSEPWQSDLFRYLLDRRHHPEAMTVPATLPKVARRAELEAASVDERRPLLRESGAELLADAGATWEWLAGWLPGGMDAEAWEAVIPSMGYMALLRNLRNFEEAGISDAATRYVLGVLADPERVARSRSSRIGSGLRTSRCRHCAGRRPSKRHSSCRCRTSRPFRVGRSC